MVSERVAARVNGTHPRHYGRVGSVYMLWNYLQWGMMRPTLAEYNGCFGNISYLSYIYG